METIIFQGKIYTVTEDADFTNRLLPDHLEGYFEMSAPAIDEDGRKCTIYWMILDTGKENLDEYDYDDPDRVEYE